ncbi:MAG: SGNH/GDSL hydrolase family protein [Bryobacteraceae bacterium]
MAIRSRALRGALLFAVSCAAVLAQPSFAVKDGDTVVFYGDSITDQRLYTTFAETYIVTRFPQLHIKFVHSGWGGDKVSGGGGGPIDLRLKRDVFAYQPSVMTIMLGMNDGRYRAFDDAIYKEFTDGYEHIIQSVKATLPNIRITVIDPSPYDDVTRAPNFPGGYNAVLIRYGQFLKDLAKKNDLNFADLNTPVVNMLQKANGADSAEATKILPDRVHPGPSGHLTMAEALLKSWNAPALVSDVEIDAKEKSASHTENADVDSIGTTASGLTWNETEHALPFPINMADPLVALVMHSSDFVSALDQETLKVSGLAPGKYDLKIDGASVGSFDASQLSDGVNLATLPTPMEKQATDVHALTLRRADTHNFRWRNIQVPLESLNLPDTAAAEKALDSLEEEIAGAQRAAAQPKAHRFELTKE